MSLNVTEVPLDFFPACESCFPQLTPVMLLCQPLKFDCQYVDSGIRSVGTMELIKLFG